ncbi:MAG: hypothetical protein JXR03_11965 [Cyclobacteriaceae bacterium]
MIGSTIKPTYLTSDYTTGQSTISKGKGFGEPDLFRVVRLGASARAGINYLRFGVFVGIETRAGITRKKDTSRENIKYFGVSFILFD